MEAREVTVSYSAEFYCIAGVEDVPFILDRGRKSQWESHEWKLGNMIGALIVLLQSDLIDSIESRFWNLISDFQL